MSAAVVGHKRRSGHSELPAPKRSRCSITAFHARGLGEEHAASSDARCAVCDIPFQPDHSRCLKAQEVRKSFPEVPIQIILRLLETDDDPCHVMHEIQKLTEAAVGCSWAASHEPGDRVALHSKTALFKRHESSGAFAEDSDLKASACDQVTRTLIDKVVSSVRESRNLDDFQSRVTPIINDFKQKTEADGRHQSKQEHEKAQQLCGRFLTAQQQKIQVLTAKVAESDVRLVENENSLGLVKEENRCLRQRNNELQFFLEHANSTMSESVHFKRPDVF